jgi:hypothetical protein
MGLSELKAQAAAADEAYARMCNDVGVSDYDLERAREHANELHNALRMAEARARGFPMGGMSEVRFPQPGRP